MASFPSKNPPASGSGDERADISKLLASFSIQHEPSKKKTERANAFADLARLIGVHQSPSSSSDLPARLLPPLKAFLNVPNTSENHRGFCALAAICELSPDLASDVLKGTNGLRQDVEDLVEVYLSFTQTSKARATKATDSSTSFTTTFDVRTSFLNLLSLCAGNPKTRIFVQECAAEEVAKIWKKGSGSGPDDAQKIVELNDENDGQETDPAETVLAGLIMVKLRMGWKEKGAGLLGSTPAGSEKGTSNAKATIMGLQPPDFVLYFMKTVRNLDRPQDQARSWKEDSILASALESISYLTTLPSIRRLVASPSSTVEMSDSLPFLRSILSITLSSITSVEGKGTSSLANKKAASSSGSARPTISMNTEMAYAISTILANLTSYDRAQKEEETEQMRKLREMAAKGDPSLSANREALEKEPYDVAHARITHLMNSLPQFLPAVQALSFTSIGTQPGTEFEGAGSVSPSGSRTIRRAMGQVWLNLTERQDRQQRGKLIQAGGVTTTRTLAVMALRSYYEAGKKTEKDFSQQSVIEASDLASFQALARFFILHPPLSLVPSSDPAQIFSFVAPLIVLILHPEANLMMNFEGLMSLTNLASVESDQGVGEQIRERVVKFDVERLEQVMTKEVESGMWKGRGVAGKGGSEDAAVKRKVEFMSKIQNLMLGENDLVRRAATQLVCNLVMCESGFEYWGGNPFVAPDAHLPSPPSETQGKDDGSKKDGNGPFPLLSSRLHLLLALSTVSDPPTQLAASGALAILTASPVACLCIVSYCQRRGIEILTSLLSAEEDFQTEAAETESKIDAITGAGLAHRGAECLKNVVQNLVCDEQEELLPAAETIRQFVSSEKVKEELARRGAVMSLVALSKEKSDESNDVARGPARTAAKEALGMMVIKRRE